MGRANWGRFHLEGIFPTAVKKVEFKFIYPLRVCLSKMRWSRAIHSPVSIVCASMARGRRESHCRAMQGYCFKIFSKTEPCFLSVKFLLRIQLWTKNRCCSKQKVFDPAAIFTIWVPSSLDWHHFQGIALYVMHHQLPSARSLPVFA